VHLDVEAPNLTTLTCFQEWFGILFFYIDTRFNLKALKSPVCKKKNGLHESRFKRNKREREGGLAWCVLLSSVHVSAESGLE